MATVLVVGGGLLWVADVDFWWYVPRALAGVVALAAVAAVVLEVSIWWEGRRGR